MRQARRREDRYWLRSNLPGEDPVHLWICDIQITKVDQAFKELKGEPGIRAIYHPRDARAEWMIHGSLSFTACLGSPCPSQAPQLSFNANAHGSRASHP